MLLVWLLEVLYLNAKGGTMKKILFTLVILMFCYQAEAKVYCLFDKTTGEGKGTASIKEDYVSDWAKDFILKEADESYRGKHGHEIKLENGKLRKSTEQEIAAYEHAQEQASEAAQKQRVLDILGLNTEDITKIKQLEVQPVAQPEEPVMGIKGKWRKVLKAIKE